MTFFIFNFIDKISFTDMIGLLQISVAFCLAYLCLDRFRYARRADNAFKDTIEETEYWVNNWASNETDEQTDKDVQEKKSSEIDATLTELRDKYKKRCSMGIGPKWCRQNLPGDYEGDYEGDCEDYYKDYYKGGNDCKLVIFITFILIILLIIATLFPANKHWLFFYSSLTFSVSGIFFPCYFIHYGNRELVEIEAYLACKLYHVRRTYDPDKSDRYKTLIKENATRAREM